MSRSLGLSTRNYKLSTNVNINAFEIFRPIRFEFAVEIISALFVIRVICDRSQDS